MMDFFFFFSLHAFKFWGKLWGGKHLTQKVGGTYVRSSVLVQNKQCIYWNVVYFPLKYRSVSVGLESTDGLTEQMKILRHVRRTFFAVVIGVKTSIQQCKNTLLLLKQIHSKCKSTDVAILRNILLGGGACLSIYLFIWKLLFSPAGPGVRCFQRVLR